ncbi:hypothetical protein [Streptomyces sp. NPDC004285]
MMLGSRVALGRLPYRIGRWALRRGRDARHTPLTAADLGVRRPLRLAGTPAAGVRALPVTVPGPPLSVARVTRRRSPRAALLADRALPAAERLPGARESALVDHERRPVEGAFAATAAGVGPR